MPTDDGANATLVCAGCNRTKRVGLYYKKARTERGYSKLCKACTKKTPEYARRLDLRYRKAYGISLDEYEDLLSKQGGSCAVCQKRPARRRLAVDHDHDRERTEGLRRSVRGLLCSVCNEYLGHIGDDPAAGTRLTRYLLAPPARQELG